MYKFTSLDTVEIKGKGTVIMVPPLDFPIEQLLNQEVEIDGTLYRVIGYGDCLVLHHRLNPDGKFSPAGCPRPAELLVKKVIAE